MSVNLWKMPKEYPGIGQESHLTQTGDHHSPEMQQGPLCPAQVVQLSPQEILSPELHGALGHSSPGLPALPSKDLAGGGGRYHRTRLGGKPGLPRLSDPACTALRRQPTSQYFCWQLPPDTSAGRVPVPSSS